MAVRGCVAIIIAIFFNHVNGRHECERPCSENAEPKECYYHFTLSFKFQKCVHVKSEECRRRIALSVNGQSPGPLINVCRGDVVTVDVKNSLPFGMEASIHWHGLGQRDSPFMDGVSMITQCPIHSGTTFRYTMKLDESGTYYYHAHSVQQQVDGLFGALVVRQDSTAEKILLIAPQFDRVISLLTGLVTDLSSPELKIFTYSLDTEDHFRRMRLINAAAIDCPLSITSTGQKLKIEAVDANKVKPVELNHIFLYPGERVDITSGFDFEITGRNLCDGQKIPGNSPIEKSGQKYGLVDYYNSLSSASYNNLEKESFRVYLPFHTATYSHGDNPVDFRYKLGEIVPYIPAYINGNTDAVSIQQFQNITFLYPSSPLLTQENDINQNLFCSSGTKAQACYSNNFCECLHILTLPFNKTVDLVIIDGGNSSQGKEQTFHLHGNKVQVLKVASFEHAINAREIQNLLDSGAVELKLISPVEKDTVAVPKMGYVVLRLKTDNPGYWLLESIPSKAESGMGLELVLYTPGEGGRSIPKGFPRCKSIKPPDLVIIEE